MIVGEVLAFEQLLIGEFIESYVPFSNKESYHFANSVSSPLAFFYAILAVIVMFYPLGVFLADVYCGRFKMVMIVLGFLVFSFSTLIVILVWLSIITKFGHHILKPLLQEYPFKELKLLLSTSLALAHFVCQHLVL